METQQQPTQRPEIGWQEVPRDGPAVLVVNARLLDLGIGYVGGWVRLDLSVPEVVEQIGQILGGERAEDYVVVDQVGIGVPMWDEHEVADLLSLAVGGRHEVSGSEISEARS